VHASNHKADWTGLSLVQFATINREEGQQSMSGFHHEIDRNKDFLALNVEPSSIHQIPGAPRSRQQEYDLLSRA